MVLYKLETVPRGTQRFLTRFSRLRNSAKKRIRRRGRLKFFLKSEKKNFYIPEKSYTVVVLYYRTKCPEPQKLIGHSADLVGHCPMSGRDFNPWQSRLRRPTGVQTKIQPTLFACTLLAQSIACLEHCLLGPLLASSIACFDHCFLKNFDCESCDKVTLQIYYL